MFNQYSQMMMSEVNYRHDLYKQEVQRERQVRQAKQYDEGKRQAEVKVSTGIKKLPVLATNLIRSSSKSLIDLM